MLSQNTGKYIVALGAVIVLIGLIVYFAGDKLNFIGKLPGDIRIERENFNFYFPITTMILFSLFLNLFLRLVNMWKA